MKPIIIAIIGAPGTGKTFLTKKLAEHLGAEQILEDEIPDRIIENLKHNKRPAETIIWFRNKCIRDMEKAQKFKKQGKTVVMDTYWLSNELYIPIMTEGFEKELLVEQAEIDHNYLPQPDIVVYLDASEETIRKLVQLRGRNFDTSEPYLKHILEIKKAHDDYYKKNKKSLVYINRDELDFGKDIRKVADSLK